MSQAKKNQKSGKYTKKTGLKSRCGKKYWDQLQEEPNECFSSFVVYRDSAPPRKIIETVLTNGREIKRATLYSWSVKYDWVKRAEQFDEWKTKVISGKQTQLLKNQTARSKAAQYENLANKFRFFIDLAGDVLLQKLINDPEYADKIQVKDLIYIQEKLIAIDTQLHGEDFFQERNSVKDLNLRKLSLQEKFLLKKLLEKASPESDAPEIIDDWQGEIQPKLSNN